MADILFIKTSSLGDVIHHMPALTEARARRPDARFAWLVEEAFAPLVRLHPAVDTVVTVAWRRWRKSLASPATLREIGASLTAIRAERYDEIVDSQGLLRSALIARVARGRRHGYDRASIREPLASLFYDVRHTRQPRPACGRPQPHPDRARARLYAAGCAGFRPRPCALPRRRSALCRAAARHRAPGKGVAGGGLDRARHGAGGRGLRSGAALGLERRTGARRAHGGESCRARACRERAAARSGGAADGRRRAGDRRRHRADASGRRARRAAGRDLHRQPAAI